MKRYTDEQKQEAYKAIKSCSNLSELSRRLNISYKTLYAWKKKFEKNEIEVNGMEFQEIQLQTNPDKSLVQIDEIAIQTGNNKKIEIKGSLNLDSIVHLVNSIQ